MKLEIKEEFSTVYKCYRFSVYVNGVFEYSYQTEELAIEAIETIKKAFLVSSSRIVYSEVV